MTNLYKSGAWLVRYALEQLPISFTFGIPGVHNTEIYDELNSSEKITPVLVTHECGAAFMGDAISRTSQSNEIGCLVIVPAAGMTHAMSGIGEAFLDGIPLLIISGGTRSDIKFGYQLHEIDMIKILGGITKGAWRVESYEDIVKTLFEAYALAVSGTPGPVFVEIPANLQLFRGNIIDLPVFKPTPINYQTPNIKLEELLDQTLELLISAKSPGIFVGWGAVDVTSDLIQIAELIGAPVSTTLQGLSAFPGNHPLFAGMGFSRASVPAAERAFENCDCLLAIGTRFGEIPTGSFGCQVPENLIHIDINSSVFDRNFKTKVAIEGDSKIIVPRLLEKLKRLEINFSSRRSTNEELIAREKLEFKHQWRAHQNQLVNPFLFFEALRAQLADDSVMVVDDGNHTFLAAELYEVRSPRSFISPTDFNCMGYAAPAAIGAKLINPKKQVVSIVGDGSFLMTGLELLTATTLNAGIVYFIFHDGELSQIAQGQQIPYNRKTCTVLGKIKLEGIALATGAGYLTIDNNQSINSTIATALTLAKNGQPIIVDVRIDYSKKTRFTEGVVKTVLKRFPLGEKFRFIGRAILRKVTG